MGKNLENLSIQMPVWMNPAQVEWVKYRALQAENTALKRENEFLGKASAFFGNQSTYEMNFYVSIKQEKAVFPITWL